MPEPTTTTGETGDALPQENRVLPELTGEWLDAMEREGRESLHGPFLAFVDARGLLALVAAARRLPELQEERDQLLRDFYARESVGMLALLGEARSGQLAAEERLAAVERERDALMRSLEDCTPGGSEYHKDPARCVAWIQDRGRFARDALLARKRVEAERDALKETSARYRAVLVEAQKRASADGSAAWDYLYEFHEQERERENEGR